ncbi:hypothetical protein EST38_g13658 [Candolleomyces aberdarensis]|uniref:Uncharacterized protein n=1 Tax=Candolleomyces aberdarensis TaxID=2316362 RepID=A0A4Q2D171_9AGAR|nr:hypothetical protein EST38_g13658 [Candolleomyces aberdarensis]
MHRKPTGNPSSPSDSRGRRPPSLVPRSSDRRRPPLNFDHMSASHPADSTESVVMNTTSTPTASLPYLDEFGQGSQHLPSALHYRRSETPPPPPPPKPSKRSTIHPPGHSVNSENPPFPLPFVPSSPYSAGGPFGQLPNSYSASGEVLGATNVVSQLAEGACDEAERLSIESKMAFANNSEKGSDENASPGRHNPIPKQLTAFPEFDSSATIRGRPRAPKAEQPSKLGFRPRASSSGAHLGGKALNRLPVSNPPTSTTPPWLSMPPSRSSSTPKSSPIGPTSIGPSPSHSHDASPSLSPASSSPTELKKKKSKILTSESATLISGFVTKVIRSKSKSSIDLRNNQRGNSAASSPQPPPPPLPASSSTHSYASSAFRDEFWESLVAQIMEEDHQLCLKAAFVPPPPSQSAPPSIPTSASSSSAIQEWKTVAKCSVDATRPEYLHISVPAYTQCPVHQPPRACSKYHPHEVEVEVHVNSVMAGSSASRPREDQIRHFVNRVRAGVNERPFDEDQRSETTALDELHAADHYLTLFSKENIFNLLKSYSALWFNLHAPGVNDSTPEEVKEMKKALKQALIAFDTIQEVYEDLPEDVCELIKNCPIPVFSGP